MDKWDKLVMLLNEYQLTSLLKAIYTNMDQAIDLDKNTKTIILTTAEEWIQTRQPLNKEIITHIIKVLKQEKIR